MDPSAFADGLARSLAEGSFRVACALGIYRCSGGQQLRAAVMADACPMR